MASHASCLQPYCIKNISVLYNAEQILYDFLVEPRKTQSLFSLIYLVAPFGIGGRNRGTWPAPAARRAGWDLLKDGICDVASGGWFLTFLLMARTRSLACFRLYAEMTTHRYRSCAMRVNRYFSNCTMKTKKPYKV